MTTKPPGAEQQLQSSYRRDAFALLLVTLGVLTLAYQVPRQFNLDTLGVELDGFHAGEGSGSRSFRWTDGHARVHFEGSGSRSYRIVLSLSGPRPNGLPLPIAYIMVNGSALGGISTTSAPRTFVIPIDGTGPAGSLDVQIDSDTFVPPNDLRTLGVAVSELRVEPAEGGFTWPAPLTLALGAITVTALFLATARSRSGLLRPPALDLGAASGGMARSHFEPPPPHGRAGLLPQLAQQSARLEATPRRAQGATGRRAAWLVALLALGILCAGVASERVLAAGLVPWAALAAATVNAGVRIKQRTTWAETAAAVTLLLSAAHFVLAFLNLFAISRFTDVATMFEAAQKLGQGLDPYDYGIIRDNPLYAHSYVYPPAFAQFLGLLLPLGTQGAIAGWVTLNFALYLIALAGLLRLFRMRWRSAGMYAMLIVAFNYQPVIDTLYGGQLDVMILALLLLSLALALRGRLASSGVALAFAAITKLHPVLILPFYLARARLRGYLGFGLAFAVIVLASIALSPPDLYLRYVTVVLPGRGGGGTGNAENQSLSGFFYRAQGFLWSDVPGSEQERGLRLWTYGAGALLGVITLGIVLYDVARGAGGPANPMRSSLHFAVFIVLMLLILPTSWMHYETQLLLPLAALLTYALAERRAAPATASEIEAGALPEPAEPARSAAGAEAGRPVTVPPVGGGRDSRGLLAAWAIAACLSAPANQEIFRGGEFDAWPLSLIQSYKLYGVLLVWGALLWAIIQEARAEKIRPVASARRAG